VSDRTGIEWTDATWNPVTGCTKVSSGCDHCYAETFAERWRGTPGHYFERGFDVQLRPEKLALPLSWRKPRRVFVNSMSDLFHDDVPDEYIARVFGVMALAGRHTFQLLTKRHARMRSLLSDPDRLRPLDATLRHWIRDGLWPLPNVWLGVSTENQQWADIRIPALLDTPAAVRWISAEPLLGPIEVRRYLSGRLADWEAELLGAEAGATTTDGIDWVVAGGESGNGARPMHPSWARSLRDQCADAGVPFLFKQWGSWCPPHPDFGQSAFGYVTNEDACQIISMSGEYLGRPWPGWKVQDGSRDAHAMRRYAKSSAGRVLDGRTHDEYPAVTA
jgi:protein gp37